MRELEKQYNPTGVEGRIYKFWEEGGYFNADVDSEKEPFTIMIPPPNITGRLHMGHAMDTTLQDILTRQKRMQGYSALWMPGTDHAAIATEAKIVEALKAEGVTKADLGREGFMTRAFQWKDEYNEAILGQLKALGASCDWRRTAFTMDEERAKAVLEAFVNMYEEGLIYRGDRIINWCPYCKTSISDAEVEYEEKPGGLWYVKYPLADGSGTITIATTRPETMLGDSGIAVNPEDERYKHLIGKTAILPLVGREIPIVGDDYVELDFGTGAVKMTPAHDPNDFEVGQRHNLEMIKVLTDDAHIVEGYGEYSGLERYEARKAIVKDLEAGGYLEQVKEHNHNTGTCYRCGTVVEPMVSLQWFVKMEPLARPAIDAVRNGEVKFVPARFDKTYFNWMENVKDWCISRQLWWGHRIPAYYCDDCGEMTVSKTTPDACPHCGGALRQDDDSLDTWFSSALWPFATLGWPEETEEYKYFYPTDVLVTGYDIIFFWVARMIFSGIHHTGKVPFHTVYMHGLVKDSQGRKMSKSLGNGIDPLDVVAQYGADALRFTLVTGSAAGADTRYSEDKVIASRNFANKLWNAARFVLMNIPEGTTLEEGLPETLELEDKWVLSAFNTLAREVTHNFDSYELGVAGTKVQDFIWDVYCDWYIEIAKLRLNGGDEEKTANARRVLVYVLRGALQLLHPYMPHITEEIYLALPGAGESIMISKWPEYDEALNFPEQAAEMGASIELIKAIRAVRTEMGVHPSRKTSLIVETDTPALFEQSAFFIERFGFATNVEVTTQHTGAGSGEVQVVTGAARAFIPMDELVDKEKEKARLDKELAVCEKDIAQLSGKLSNENFTAKAPQAVVDAEKQKLAAAQDKRDKIMQSIAALG